MEPEEIEVVLARASGLQSKLSNAIAFVVNDAPSHPPSSSTAARIQDLQNGDGSADFSSLASIQNALEILKDQLESLQALQQQQRAERDAGLAQIEESRRVFLKRLKDYRGRDFEAVQEALAFAGGSVPERDDLPPGYPSLTEDEASQAPLVSISTGRSGTGGRQQMVQEPNGRNDMFAFDIGAEEEYGSEGESAYEGEGDPDSLIGDAMKAANVVKNSVTHFGLVASSVNALKSSVALLGHLVSQISGKITGPSSKVVLIVVSTLAVLSLTDLGERKTKSVSRVSRMSVHRSVQHHKVAESSMQHGVHKEIVPEGTKVEQSQAVESPVQSQNFVSGNQMATMVDAFPNCVVRQRLELPFYQELQTADVLHGQG